MEKTSDGTPLEMKRGYLSVVSKDTLANCLGGVDIASASGTEDPGSNRVRVKSFFIPPNIFDENSLKVCE
jgi:hypothetical protein